MGDPRIKATKKISCTILCAIALLVSCSVVQESAAPQAGYKSIPSYGMITEGRILWGLNMHPWDVNAPYFAKDKYFDLAKDSGAKWIRLAVTDPLDNAWSGPWFKLFVEEAHARQIKVLGILDRYIVGENSSFSLADWQNGLNVVMGVYGDTVDAWEVWNEPNLPEYYFGYTDGTPEHYVDLLKTSYQTIKACNPEALVVFGGLSPCGTNCTEFASECWELGAASYCDVFAIHVYEPYADQLLSPIASITAPKPIWITETGVSSLDFGLDGQSQELILLNSYFNNVKEEYRIQNVFWYCWMDYAGPNDQTNVFGSPVSSPDFCGLVTMNLTQKQSYETYQALA